MIKKLFIAALLAAPLCLSAQNKIGSVNSQEILPLMPEVKQAQTTLETVSKQYDEEFQNLQNEFNKKLQEYQALAQDTPESIRQRREQDLQELDTKIRNFQEAAGRDMSNQQQQLMIPIQEKVMSAIKSVGDEVITDKAEVLMFYAARVQLVETVIKPALANGTWVIGDRHDLSTQAYQGGGRGIDQHMLATLRDAVLGDFRPDLTLYLDVTPEVGLKRARARGELDRIEQESFDFFNRTRARYLELAAQDKSIHTIDATQPLEAVMDAIRTTVTHWVKELDA